MQRKLSSLQLLARLIGAALTLISAASAAGQEPVPGGAEAPFLETLNVEIINIDVWVTDRKGKPVKGLTREDFTVHRDGAEVEVANFYAVEDGRARDELLTVPSAPDLDSIEAAPLRTIAPEHRLWLIVYVDNFNIHPLHRQRVFPAIRQFLGSSLTPGDQGMVVSYDRSLKVRQPFTERFSLLHDALLEMEDDIGHAVVRARQRTDTLGLIADAADPSQALSYARLYAENQMNEVTFTARALKEMIDSLAGLPGRKALLYVTSGVPLLAGQEMFEAVASIGDASAAYSEIARHDTSREFETVGHHATANRVVFHTMDAGGLRGMMFGTAEYGSFMTSGLRSTLESTVTENLQSTLRLLAEETGGRVIVNRNEVLPALVEVNEDFRTFYSLGVSNPNTVEGRFHEVKVKLKEKIKGVTVRHRKGYRSKGLEARMTESVRAALLYDHLENSHGLSAKWGRPEPEVGGKHYVLTVQLDIPLADVVLLPAAEGRYELRLRLYAGVADESGDISDIEGVPLGLRIAEEHVDAAKGESFLYTHRMRVERGRHKVALAIFDHFGNQSSIVTRVVDIQ